MSLLDNATPRDLALLGGTMSFMAHAFGVKAPLSSNARLPRTVEDWERAEELLAEVEALESDGLDFGVTL